MSNAGFRPQEIHRRKFQQAVAKTFDAQAQAIQVTREFVADLAARLDKLELEKQTTATRFEAFRFASSFWQRLRWLVSGR